MSKNKKQKKVINKGNLTKNLERDSMKSTVFQAEANTQKRNKKTGAPETSYDDVVSAKEYQEENKL